MELTVLNEKKTTNLCVVVPCYNEEKTISIFYKKMLNTLPLLSKIDIEFLFIDDGSRDGTMAVIKNLALKDRRVKYISLSRNFGKESAIYAGLQHAKGDFVVVMDVDLQHPPSILPKMFDIMFSKHCTSVATRRISRNGEAHIRSFCGEFFYKISNNISAIKMPRGAMDFRLMSRKYVDQLLLLTEKVRFTKGLFAWVGLKTEWLELENTERAAGQTKWSFFDLLRYAISGITSFTTFPLQISTFIGVLFFIFSILMVAYKIATRGTTLIIASVFFVGGTVLIALGVIGQYLSQIFTEVKARPVYLIEDTNIDD